jgi:acyl-CoA reductase-like NAD-dependent aldehyde dehydrogenase
MRHCGIGTTMTSFAFGLPRGCVPALDEVVAEMAASIERTRALSTASRADILQRIAAELARDPSSIARSLTEESGYLTLRDMELEVHRAIEVFTLTAAYVRTGMTEPLEVDAVERGRGAIGFVRREPYGVVLGITAFNGPLLIPTHKLAPAIGAGAPLLLKPSPRVPNASVQLAKLAVQAGWPAAAIAVLNVGNDETLRLVKDPRLPVVSFTGGAFGWTIKDVVPRKHVHLELGGVGAVYVAADANLSRAAEECAAGAFVRSGQSCISVQRIYVARATYEAFIELLARFVPHLEAGDATPVGTLVDERAASRVEQIVSDAVARGASVVCGGMRSGAWVAPTLIRDASSQMEVMRIEAFGPVLAVEPVDSIDEAIARINAVEGAIHHGIYTRSIDDALLAAQRIDAGGVIINGSCTWRVDHMPYGGTGRSGFGREGVKHAIAEFTRPKAIVIRPAGP